MLMARIIRGGHSRKRLVVHGKRKMVCRSNTTGRFVKCSSAKSKAQTGMSGEQYAMLHKENYRV